MKKDLLTFAQWSVEELKQVLKLASSIKQNPADYAQALAGKSVVGLFEKPSLRTRVSFDIGINKLGGHFLYLDSNKDSLNGREDVKDMAANLSCWADAIVARVFAHETLEQFAKYGSKPVVNALCDHYHPCQALADYLTLQEARGNLTGASIAYIGDGNNVSHSLLIAGAMLGVDVRVITPEGHGVSPVVVEQAKNLAAENGGKVTISNDLAVAEGVDALYADTWLSMGDNTPLAEIEQAFAPYQLNSSLMQKTGAKYVMHCQPAHRDQEISGELMDSEHSLLMQQAENRMYGQMAVLVTLLS